jgi:hypothetical protein
VSVPQREVRPLGDASNFLLARPSQPQHSHRKNKFHAHFDEQQEGDERKEDSHTEQPPPAKQARRQHAEVRASRKLSDRNLKFTFATIAD